MNSRTFQVTLDECTDKPKRYELEVHADKLNSSVAAFVQVYKLRKNGTRGMLLSSVHSRAWQAWQKIRTGVLAKIDGQNECWVD